MSDAGRAAFRLAYEISPILLTRGIAAKIPGGVLPIVALTDAARLASGILTSVLNFGGPNIDFDDFFAKWYVLPGSTLINQQVGMYPFANQAVAANAVIAQPNNVSMMMLCPARPGTGALGTAVAGAIGALFEGAIGAAGGAALSAIGGYAAKLATMTALTKTIALHNSLGGTYSVVTPAQIYIDCVMTSPGIIDVSSEGETQQRQYRYQWNFVQPQVLTQAQANNALNSAMLKLKQGLPLGGASQIPGASGLAFGSGGPLAGLLTPTQGAIKAGLSLVPS
jgi:hypothetical protein